MISVAYIAGNFFYEAGDNVQCESNIFIFISL